MKVKINQLVASFEVGKAIVCLSHIIYTYVERNEGFLFMFTSSQVYRNEVELDVFLVEACQNSPRSCGRRSSMDFNGCHDLTNYSGSV